MSIKILLGNGCYWLETSSRNKTGDICAPNGRVVMRFVPRDAAADLAAHLCAPSAPSAPKPFVPTQRQAYAMAAALERREAGTLIEGRAFACCAVLAGLQGPDVQVYELGGRRPGYVLLYVHGAHITKAYHKLVGRLMAKLEKAAKAHQRTVQESLTFEAGV